MPFMENSIALASRDKCTGCGVCADVCTKKCITLEYYDSIHSYPIIDTDKCVSCGMCMKICPALNMTEQVPKVQKYYKAWHNDVNERMTSTSGGAGVAMVDSALLKGWYVCGAAMDESFVLKHIVTDDAGMAKLFKGSKYLQSNMEGVYKKIRTLLKEGEKVLFIGTPCQVEGLNHFLHDDLKNNLLTCGIICHGVNSPKVWGDYKVWLEYKQKSKLSEYQFRSKSHGWQKKKGGPNLRVAYSFDNGKTIDQPAWMNLFHWWFGHHYILRPACLNCDYRKEYRNSDVTIGDFWGVERVSSNVDTYRGVSVVITSTEKGGAFVRDCKSMHCEELDASRSKQVLRGYIENQPVEQRMKQIEREKSFEAEYLRFGIDKMAVKYPAQTHVSRTIHLIKSKIGLR